MRLIHLYYNYIKLLILIMPRGKELSVRARQRVIDLRDCGMSQIKIGRRLNRSQNYVGTFLQKGIEN